MASKKKTYAPRSIKGVKIEAKGTSKIKLSWTNDSSTSRPYSSILLQKKVDSGKKSKWETAKTLTGKTTSVELSCPTGHKYRYRLIPKNSKGYPTDSKGRRKYAYSKVFNNPKPNAPKSVSNLACKQNNATSRIELRWKNNESRNREYDGVYVYVQTDRADEYEELTSSKGSSYVATVVPGHWYKFRIEAHNDKGFSSPVYSGEFWVPPLKPLAPSSASASRESDSRHVIEWDRDATAGRDATAMVVQRSTDGGGWSTVAEIGPVDSWTDGATSANHSYRWRICARNEAGDSPWAYTATVVTAPAAPGTPSGDRLGDGTVRLSIPNAARNVTATQIRRYDVEFDQWSEPVEYAGLVTSLADASAPADATLQYQARNVWRDGKDELLSPWSGTSAKIVPKGRPKAPTPLSPDARAVIADDDMALEVSWRHNPVDGSAQTAAQVLIAWDGGSKVFSVAGAAQSLRIPSLTAAGCAVALNEQFTWQVRTRGAYRGTAAPDDDNMSPWCEARAATICRAPQVAFVLPGASGYVSDPGDLDAILEAGAGESADLTGDDFSLPEDYDPDVEDDDDPEPEGDLAYALLADFPLSLAIDYTDESGGLAQCTLTVSDSTGLAVYSQELADMAEDGTVTGEVTRRQWAPANHARYTLSVTARSTSSLMASCSIQVLTDFDLPKRASLEIEADRERGWVTLTPRVADNQDGAEPDGVDIWRVVGGEQVLIATDLVDGQSFTDRHAPLNTEFTYRTAVYSRGGTYRTVDHPGSLKTPYAFLYFGDGGVARGMWSPTEKASLTRTRRRYVEYADREYEVLYDGGGRGEDRDMSFNVRTREEAEALAEVMEHGRAVCKTLTGAVFWCTVDVEMNMELRYSSRFCAASVKVHRIDGEAL